MPHSSRIFCLLRRLMTGFVLILPVAPQNSPEPGATFRTRVDLVTVPVVVRDSKGRTVATLTKEDFQLFDNREARPIVQFAVERFRAVQGGAQALAAAPSAGAPVAPAAVPNHFTAYLFDDLHAGVPGMADSRLAALQHLRGLAPSTRAAIYTTSGRNTRDFTADQELLRKAVEGLRSAISPASASLGCPSISHYEAYLAVAMKQGDVFDTLLKESRACSMGLVGGASMVETRSRQVLEEGRYQSRLSLIRLREVIRRLAVTPGRRVLVMVSPGFLLEAVEAELNAVTDEALRAGIVINTLDSRGLYTEISGGDATTSIRGSMEVIQRKSQYLQQAVSFERGVLDQLARSTGGTFFRNRNDLETGLNQLAAPPEAYYVLGFTPGRDADNGRFHTLKVKLTGQAKGLTVQARQGYMARQPGASTASRSKEDLQEELLSREDLNDVPVTLETGLDLLKLTVTAAIDYVRLEEVAGARPKSLVVVSGVFDGNGKLVRAIQKTLDLSQASQAEDQLRRTGLVTRSEFQVSSGPHTVRVLVRSAEGKLLAASTQDVLVP